MFYRPLSEENKREIAINRDERIFRAFFIANFKSLKDYAQSLVKDNYIAEDIASEVMWKIWHLGSDLAHISSVESYLSRIVKNKSLNYLRIKQAVYVGHDELADHVQMDDFCPEKILISNERMLQIEQAINALPSKTQQAFRLVKEEGNTYNEAAKRMEISPKTVDRHIQIALQKLWNTLKKEKK